MYQALLDIFKHTPAPFESTGLPFWDDGHISRSMLAAHLNPDEDGASRRHSFIRQSAGWIAGLASAPAGTQLLDLGCGPGLYAEAFAELGLKVTGVDFSRRSFEYAAGQAALKNLGIRYIYQNYLEIGYSEEFGLAILIYCDYGALAPKERAALLRKTHSALKPGGLFVMDAFTPNQYRDFQAQTQAVYEESGFWSQEPYLCVKRELAYENRDYLEQYTVITAEELKTYNIWNHAFTAGELEQDLARAGFGAIEFYGDAAGALPGENDKTICAVCRKE